MYSSSDYFFFLNVILVRFLIKVQDPEHILQLL